MPDDPLDAFLASLAARFHAWLLARFDEIEAEAGLIGRAGLRLVRGRALRWGDRLAAEFADHAKKEATRHTIADAARGVARLFANDQPTGVPDRVE